MCLRRRHPYNVSQTGFSRGILESLPCIVRMGANAIAILLIAYLLPTVMSAGGPMAALAVAFVVINGLLLWLVSAIELAEKDKGHKGAAEHDPNRVNLDESLHRKSGRGHCNGRNIDQSGGAKLDQ